MPFKRVFVFLILLLKEYNVYCRDSKEDVFQDSLITQITNSENYFGEATTESASLEESRKETSTAEVTLPEAEKKLSEQLLELLEHFKQPNNEGIPGMEIPDPYPVPDVKHSVTYFDILYLEKTFVHGFSKLRLLGIHADFENMKVHATMIIDHLEARGHYLLSSFVMPRQGQYTVNITGLKITPQASLGVEIDGKLKTRDINIDLAFVSNHTSIAVNFENLGSILQGFINSAGNLVFDQMKPHILRQTYTKAREEIDRKLEDIAGDIKFPNTIPPLDMVLVDARRKVQELGMDPYRIYDYKNNDSMLFLSASLSNTWLTGLSTFHRIGDVILTLESNTVVADIEIGTKELEGMTAWEVSAGGLMSLAGTASFSVEHMSLRAVIALSLDTRQRPVLRNIELDVGNVQIRCNGAGTLDYIVEFAVNILPNLLRYQIIAALEGPLKTKLQEELNGVNVEEEIKQALPKIDEMAKQGFKLSMLRSSKVEPLDDDEFFNF